MKHRSKTLALGLALFMASGQLSIAQEHHDDAVHPEAKPEHKVEQKRVVVQKQVNEHVNEHVTEHKTVAVRDEHPGPRPIASAGGGHWHHGDRFSGNRVVFTDYDRYHVRRPPPGYEWVRADGGQLVLISLATGIVTDTFIISVP